MVYKIMQESLSFAMRGDYNTAIKIMDDLLYQELDSDLKSEALSFRASLKEDQGDYLGAKEDLVKAHHLISEFSFSRYTIELGIGDTCNKLGMHNEATTWYKKAIMTSIEGKRISAGPAIKSFIENKKEDKIDEQERIICSQATNKSWKLFGLPGKPDISDLMETAKIIINAEKNQGK